MNKHLKNKIGKKIEASRSLTNDKQLNEVYYGLSTIETARYLRGKACIALAIAQEQEKRKLKKGYKWKALKDNHNTKILTR